MQFRIRGGDQITMFRTPNGSSRADSSRQTPNVERVRWLFCGDGSLASMNGHGREACSHLEMRHSIPLGQGQQLCVLAPRSLGHTTGG